MTRIVLVRHGHVEGIQPERFRGRAELALTPLGHEQIAATADYVGCIWPDAAAVYTSPMGRCVITGGAIATACGLEARVHPGLNDLDYGRWQGRIQAEIKQEEPQAYRLWREHPHLVRFPDGESLQELVARTADVVRFAVAQYPGKTVILVGHDSVNKALLLQLLDQPLAAYWRIAQDPCAISVVDIDDGVVTARCINSTAHLQSLQD